jgi:hypothetical protein
MRGRGNNGSSSSSSDGSGGKPLSPAQASERIGKLGKQMDALAAAAGEADKRKDYAGTQRILEEWSKVRSIYNRIAAGSDYAEVGKFTKRLPNFEANYQKSGKKLPIQRQSVKRDKTLTYNPKTGKLEE